jgi:hypothetical protein
MGSGCYVKLLWTLHGIRYGKLAVLFLVSVVITSDPKILLTFETIEFSSLSSVRNVLVLSYFVLFGVGILKLPINLLSMLAQALTLSTCIWEVPGFNFGLRFCIFLSLSRQMPG